MNKIILACLIIFFTMNIGTLSAAEHRIGGGANYWTTLDDIDIGDGSKVDDDGFSLLASYQYWTGLFGLELDVEFLPDRFGESAFAPQAYALIGTSIYAGAGIGYTYSDSSFSDSPFFALKAGINLELLPGIYGDIYANYRFNDSADLNDDSADIDTDTVFLGFAVRVAL